MNARSKRFHEIVLTKIGEVSGRDREIEGRAEEKTNWLESE